MRSSGCRQGLSHAETILYLISVQPEPRALELQTGSTRQLTCSSEMWSPPDIFPLEEGSGTKGTREERDPKRAQQLLNELGAVLDVWVGVEDDSGRGTEEEVREHVGMLAGEAQRCQRDESQANLRAAGQVLSGWVVALASKWLPSASKLLSLCHEIQFMPGNKYSEIWSGPKKKPWLETLSLK